MPPKSLDDWLQTESNSAGYKDNSIESIGHQLGLRILDKNKADLSEEDYAHMAKVVGYIKRHSLSGQVRISKRLGVIASRTGARCDQEIVPKSIPHVHQNLQSPCHRQKAS